MQERQNNRIVAGGLRHRFVVRSAGQGKKKKRKVPGKQHQFGESVAFPGARASLWSWHMVH